jgi:hypothetical protein
MWVCLLKEMGFGMGRDSHILLNKNTDRDEFHEPRVRTWRVSGKIPPPLVKDAFQQQDYAAGTAFLRFK